MEIPTALVPPRGAVTLHGGLMQQLASSPTSPTLLQKPEAKLHAFVT